MSQPAVFLDRDGTIIEDRGYIGDPDEVQLLPGAAGAVRRFAQAGYKVVVVSNQSGVARGLFDVDEMNAVHARFAELLSAEDAVLDGAHYCPYLAGPEATVKAYRKKSNLRKPMPGMLLQAAREQGIDLKRSWMIGNSPHDVEAGKRAGCKTIHITGSARPPGAKAPHAAFTVASLAEAADLVEQYAGDPAPRAAEAGIGGPAAAQDADAREPAAAGEIVKMLSKIHDQLDRSRRHERQRDFSLLRLFGALLQMFAIMAALWGTAALLGDEHQISSARLALACFLQLASISAFAIDRFS